MRLTNLSAKTKNKPLFFLFLLFLPFPSFSQVSKGEINPENFRQDLLSNLIFDKINEARDSLGLQMLEKDSILQKAAQQHAQYLKKTGRLSHKQKNRKFVSPAKRVKHFGGDFKAVAENVFLISAGPTIIKGSNREFSFNSYQDVATEIVKGWINSPGHFKNISDADMDHTGVAVSYDQNKNIIYAVQVFTESLKDGERPVVKILWFIF